MQECLLPRPGAMSLKPADTGQNSLNSFEMKWNSLDSYINIIFDCTMDTKITIIVLHNGHIDPRMTLLFFL